ncbi:hypothetical protein ABEW34_30415 [Paenibacillus algorifonticola]
MTIRLATLLTGCLIVLVGCGTAANSDSEPNSVSSATDKCNGGAGASCRF